MLGYDDSLTVSAGASTTATVFAGSYGRAAIYGSALRTQVSATDFEDVFGVESGGHISSGGSATVESGGAVLGEQVYFGGLLTLGAGATASAVVVGSGGEVAFAALISSGQSYTAVASGSATSLEGVTVRAGGELILERATVASGGVLSLAAGAAALGLIVQSGGLVKGPGAVLEDYADNDAPSEVFGKASGVTVGDADAGFGVLVVEHGGSAIDITVLDGKPRRRQRRPRQRRHGHGHRCRLPGRRSRRDRQRRGRGGRARRLGGARERLRRRCQRDDPGRWRGNGRLGRRRQLHQGLERRRTDRRQRRNRQRDDRLRRRS